MQDHPHINHVLVVFYFMIFVLVTFTSYTCTDYLIMARKATYWYKTSEKPLEYC